MADVKSEPPSKPETELKVPNAKPKEDEALGRYYLLEDTDDHGYIFVTATELDRYFDLIHVDGWPELTARVNLNKDHRCTKIGRDGPFPLCNCERFDSWICNRSFRHVKGALPFGPGIFDRPIVILGILPLLWR